MNDLYHNDTDNGGRPNIPVKTMVKVLFLQSMFNMVDEQAETLIKDRTSFMNFLDYPDQYPDERTIWLFRERLSKTGKDHETTIDLSKRGIIVYRDRGYFGHDLKGIDGTMDRSVRNHKLPIESIGRNLRILRKRSLVEYPYSII